MESDREAGTVCGGELEMLPVELVSQVLKTEGQTPAVGFPGRVDAPSRSVDREAVKPEKVRCDEKWRRFLVYCPGSSRG